jgi:hypothetical protein
MLTKRITIASKIYSLILPLVVIVLLQLTACGELPHPPEKDNVYHSPVRVEGVEWLLPLGTGMTLKLSADFAESDELMQSWVFMDINLWVLNRDEMLAAGRAIWAPGAQTLMFDQGVKVKVAGTSCTAERISLNLTKGEWLAPDGLSFKSGACYATAKMGGGLLGSDSPIWMKPVEVNLSPLTSTEN